MKERHGLITMKGNPLTLIGNEINVGEKVPDFTVLDNKRTSLENVRRALEKLSK